MMNKIKKMIEEILGSDVSIEANTNIIDDLGLDSLQIIRLMLSIEEECDIEIDYETFDFDMLKSAGQFCRYLDDMISEAAS